MFKGQSNLVPNPSFEDLYSCFVGMGLLSDTINGNNYIKNWFTAENMTPEYNNTCANTIPFQGYPNSSSVPQNCVGYQYPRTGNAYVSPCLCEYMWLPDSSKINTELVMVKLKAPLKQNRCYYGEFYYNLANRSKIIINHLGMYLANSSVTFTIPSSYGNNVVPQIEVDTTQFISTDTLNWIKVSGTFVAQGGEEVLHIGNFKDGKHVKIKNINSSFTPTCMVGTTMCFIHIDDVSLYELPQNNDSVNNYTICIESDSLLLGDVPYPGSTYQWFANGAPMSTQSQIKVKPNTTTNYVLQTTACGTSTQSFVVTYNNICPPIDTVLVIPNAFTPNNDSVNDVFRFTISNVKEDVCFAVYNRWGNLVKEITSNEMQPNIYSQLTIQWDGRTTSGEPCSEGVYFYTLKYTNTKGEQQSRNGYLSLFR